VTWEADQRFEHEWWGTCQNTYGEETKQLIYAKLMGLVATHDGNSPFSFDMNGKSILDIGGGPSSLLLKCRNLKEGWVMDPCPYPRWVAERYNAARIIYMQLRGETLGPKADEVWIYNVLQHTQDPEKIIKNARKLAPVIRIFEWINIPPHEGHPHMLTYENLNQWLGHKGLVGDLNGEGNCHGEFYAGVF